MVQFSTTILFHCAIKQSDGVLGAQYSVSLLPLPLLISEANGPSSKVTPVSVLNEATLTDCYHRRFPETQPLYPPPPLV